MDLAQQHMQYLRRRRAEYIGAYKRRSFIPSRQDARMWALFYSQLIRKFRHAGIA
jgi:hypothetical protein